MPAAPRPDAVRPLSAAARRRCVRPGCPAPAAATLTFVYAERRVRLDDLSEDRAPVDLDLCLGHADRTSPPHGWELTDARARHGPAQRAGDPGGPGTVAVLAEALGRRGDPPDRRRTASW